MAAYVIFDVPPADLWRVVLLEKGSRYWLLANSPEDPSVN